MQLIKSCFTPPIWHRILFFSSDFPFSKKVCLGEVSLQLENCNRSRYICADIEVTNKTTSNVSKLTDNFVTVLITN